MWKISIKAPNGQEMSWSCNSVSWSLDARDEGEITAGVIPVLVPIHLYKLKLTAVIDENARGQIGGET